MRIVQRRSTLFQLCGLALFLTACTVSLPDTAQTRDPVGTSDLGWTSCHDQFQCATLTVPLDWFDPKGETIALALIRKPALDPNPIGSILLNPGGPGAPGTTFLMSLLDTPNFPDELSRNFDVVSWDPRGTGKSAGIVCLSEEELTEADPLAYPDTEAARAKVAAEGMAQLNDCLKDNAKVISHVGTIQTVHDLDAIRAALGDDKLTYVGFSYGTAIGLEYLKLFGDHVRAMVLDGIDLPGADPIKTTRAQMESFEANLNLFLADCRDDPSCTFGHGHPKKALLEFLDSLTTGRRIPATYTLPDDNGNPHTRVGTLGSTEAITGIATALYSRQTWSVLRRALAIATREERSDGHLLLALRDLLAGRRLDGTWDHSTEARAAISCADQLARADSYFGDPKRIVKWSRELPVFGAFGAVGLPGCFGWPPAQHPLDALKPTQFAQAPDIVLVNSAHDPATPYANAKAAMRLLSGSRLVTWEGADHTSFAGGHECIDQAVVPYLVDLELPAESTRCAAPEN